MEPEEVRRHLEETGALLRGHFLLSSGLHSDAYVQCARVLSIPSRASLLGSALGALWQEEAIDLVVGPALGGILIAHEVARYLGTPCFFTERHGGRMELRRGFDLAPATRVLVVEDVITTGGSAREVADLCATRNAVVVGVGSLIWRSPKNQNEAEPATPLGTYELRTLLKMDFDANPPRECPQCRAGKPIDQPGSREFAEARRGQGPDPIQARSP